MLWINGEILSDKRVAFFEALRWADGIGTSFRVDSGSFLAPTLHFERLRQGAEWLGAQVPFSYDFFERFVLSPLSSHQADKRQLWRAQVAIYFIENSYHCLLTLEPFQAAGIREIYCDLQLPQNYFLSNGTLVKPLGYSGVQRIRRTKKLRMDQDFLWGDENEIFEASTSALLIVLGQRIITTHRPVVESVMINYLTQNGIVAEKVRVDLATILRADEVILINSVQQLVTVVKFRDRHYDQYLNANSKTQYLLEKFGELWKKS